MKIETIFKYRPDQEDILRRNILNLTIALNGVESESPEMNELAERLKEAGITGFTIKHLPAENDKEE